MRLCPSRFASVDRDGTDGELEYIRESPGRATFKFGDKVIWLGLEPEGPAKVVTSCDGLEEH
jgi:hypothetical protein